MVPKGSAVFKLLHLASFIAALGGIQDTRLGATCSDVDMIIARV